jgi:methylmalonyl-CoA mutase cobalamin-binding subunit
VGLVLATPITVCLVVLGSYIPQLAFLTVILGDEPVLDDDARIYNRLLSGATDEAFEIAGEFLEEHSLPELYDDVLLPALESAETDRSENMLSVKRYDRILSCMTALVDSVNDKLMQEKEEEISIAQEESDEPAPAPNPNTPIEEPLPKRNVVCVPVNDQTDEMAAHMLRHLLLAKPFNVLVLPPGTLVSEVIDAIKEFEADVIILSSVPPFAVTHTRYLAKRLSEVFPDAKLYAGLWRGDKTLEKVDQRLKLVGIEHIYTSLMDASLHV